MVKWLQHAKKADFRALSVKYGIDPLLARIIRNRDYEEDALIESFIKASLSDCHDPSLLADASLACSLLKETIDAGQKIRVVGDYDVDGVCSTTILVKGLEACGARVDYDVPNRVTDGYGMNERIVDDAIRDGVDLIITCDNGISAADAASKAKEAGLKLIITDHHGVPFLMEDGKKIQLLPQADAVVDPARDDCPYPFKRLCGAGVALKIIKLYFDKYMGGFDSYRDNNAENDYNAKNAEYAKNANNADCDNNDNYDSGSQIRDLVKDLRIFASLATVADVVSLTDENRIIVKYGMEKIKESKNLGLLALIEACDLKFNKINSFTYGFVLGPTINAAGRLESAKIAIDLFLSKDPEEARVLAKKMRELNEKRKSVTDEEANLAYELIERDNMLKDKVLVVYLPECPEYVAGIVASRIKDRYYRPSILLTRSEAMIKGSARSIEGYNLFEELTKVKELLDKFGGHPMAAGLSLKEENLDKLRQRLNENENMTEEILTEKKWIDAVVSPSYFTVDRIKEFELLEPYGTDNDAPIFGAMKLKVDDVRYLGAKQNTLKLSLSDNFGSNYSAIKFRLTEDDKVPVKGDVINMIYTPSINEFNNRVSVQCIIEDITSIN